MELVKVNAPEGMSAEKAEEVKEAFKGHIVAMEGLEAQFDTMVAVTGVPSPELCEAAKALRLQYRTTRTGTAKTHKGLKADALNYGRYLDGMKKAQLLVCENREERLREIEEYHERIEKDRIVQMVFGRNAELVFNGLDENPTGIMTMTEDEWEAFVSGLVSLKKKRAADAKAEAEENDRIRKENGQFRRESAERKEKADKLAREETAAKMKAENKTHRDAVNSDVVSYLTEEHGMNAESAKILVVAIEAGDASHLTIKY